MTIIHSLYNEPGRPTINKDLCVNCGECAAVCPSQVLVMEQGALQVKPDTEFGCIACGHCMMVCPEDCLRVSGRGLEDADLIERPAAEEIADERSLLALFRSRRSVRRFTAQEVDRKLMQKIVEMASNAPMGIPPWDVGCVIVHGRNEVQKLAAAILASYGRMEKLLRPWLLWLLRPLMKRTTYQRFRTFLVPLAKLYTNGRRNGQDLLFYNAPAVIIFHHSPYADATDAVIACTYAMLAAESLGLGTTMIGAAAPILQRNKKVCGAIGIPRANTPAIALIVGHSDVKFKRGIRRHFSSVKAIS